jgi:hypothetical protein
MPATGAGVGDPPAGAGGSLAGLVLELPALATGARPAAAEPAADGGEVAGSCAFWRQPIRGAPSAAQIKIADRESMANHTSAAGRCSIRSPCSNVQKLPDFAAVNLARLTSKAFASAAVRGRRGAGRADGAECVEVALQASILRVG